MPIGINSRVLLAATTYTTVATTPASGKVQMLNVSICNQNSTSVTFRLAVVNNGTTTPSNGDWLEYGATITANNVYERSGVILQNGQTLVAYSSATNVSVVTYGLEDNTTSANTGAFKFSLTANTWSQASAGPASGRFQTVSLNFENPTAGTVSVSACIATTFNSPATSDYIEYQTLLAPGATLERTGIVIGNGQQIGVWSNTSTVSCVAFIVDDA